MARQRAGSGGHEREFRFNRRLVPAAHVRLQSDVMGVAGIDAFGTCPLASLSFTTARGFGASRRVAVGIFDPCYNSSAARLK